MIRGLLFDLNGTVIDIWTDEGDPQVYRVTANYLDYCGISIAPEQLKEQFAELNREQRRNSPEKYPEFDVVKIFRDIILGGISPVRYQVLNHQAESAAVVFRAVSRRRLELYPDVCGVLDRLKADYQLAAVSDGQPLWAIPELRSVGLEPYFSPVVISGDFGFRKPDSRLFQLALDRLGLHPQETVFVGNDMFRDIYGASQTGMRTVFFKSNQGDHRYHGAEPDYIIHHFRELPQALAYLSGKDAPSAV